LIGLGFTTAFAVYLAYVFWELRSSQAVPSDPGRELRPSGGELKALYVTAKPLLYIMVLGQVLTIVDRAAASFVGVGAIASLEYARVFVETPHVLVGTAIATTVLSRFSALDEGVATARATTFILALLTTALGGMVVLAGAAPELVSAFYQRGKFDAAAAASVTLAVRGLAPGGAFMTASYVMNRVLSAQMRNRENVAPMVVCVLVAIALNVVLAPRLGILGVGIAMSMAYVALFVLLAARLDMWPLLVQRAPAWIVGGAMAATVALLVRLTSGSPALRLAGTCTGCTVAWFTGVALFRAGRADLATLREQLGRLTLLSATVDGAAGEGR
jgi:peptidoglycan biosynthesis protein MviN/MurJ (putative lipid II flippase)